MGPSGATAAKIRQIQLPKPKLDKKYKILKFAIDNGRPQECADLVADRSDKDHCNSASPKPTSAAASATTTCGLRPRSTSGSLAQCLWIVAGERGLIFNTQQAVAKRKYRQKRQVVLASAILTGLEGWRERYRLKLAYTYTSKSVDTQGRSGTIFCSAPHPSPNCELPYGNSFADISGGHHFWFRGFERLKIRFGGLISFQMESRY